MKTALIAALLLFSATVSAQPYVMGGIASTEAKASGAQDEASRLNLGIGYRAGKFAAEAACIGSADCSLSGLVALPVAAGFSLVGKAGAHYLRGDATGPGPAGGGFSPSTSQRESWSGWTAGAGIGVEYAPKGFGARLMLEQTGSVGRLDRARSLGLSVLYSF